MDPVAPDWSLYRVFLAVLDAGSLSGAARALRIAQPTVGRQIAALETALSGSVLFTRSPGGLKPTQAAFALAPHARAMASAAEAVVRAASGETAGERGVIRLTASEIGGVEILPAILTRFHEAHAGIAIELALSNRQEDLLRREADIAVRMTRPTQGALVALRLGTARIQLYAHHRYLERHGTPETLADLAGHSVIGFDRLGPPPEMLAALGPGLSRDLFALRTDNDLAGLAALRAGFGIGACQRGIARRDPDLVPLLEDQFGFDLEAWLAMHEDLKASRRMRLLFDHLGEEMKAFLAE
ncbi:MAG: LysR family transcriptional regulator [Caulobacteraceae bacterium]